MFGEHMQDLLDHSTEPEPDEPPRELTVDEAVQIAIQLQRDDHLEEADVVFGHILKVDPDNPRALHFSGILAHQLGRGNDGIALIEKSLSIVPDSADWYNNLGIVLQESNHLDESHRGVSPRDCAQSEPCQCPQQPWCLAAGDGQTGGS